MKLPTPGVQENFHNSLKREIDISIKDKSWIVEKLSGKYDNSIFLKPLQIAIALRNLDLFNTLLFKGGTNVDCETLEFLFSYYEKLFYQQIINVDTNVVDSVNEVEEHD